jgi:hypothetical protein
MRDDEVSVTIEGEPVSRNRGRERSIAEVNAEADKYAADAARYRNETAYWRQQSHQALRDQLAMDASLLDAEREKAEAKLGEGVDYGDRDKVIEAQRALSDIDARRRQNEYAQRQVNSRPADPVEAYVQGRDERSTAWLRSHPEYVTDRQKNWKLNAAHSDAIAEGHAPNSDAYMAHVENYLGIRGNGDDVRSPRARQTSQQKPQVVQFKNQAALDHAKEMAEACGMTLEKYLKVKQITDTSPEWRRVDELGGTV